jgi:polar amino acid transport system permease protein
VDYILSITTFILKGVIVTLKLYAVTAVFSLPIGILVAIGKVSGPKILKKILGLYTWVLRGTPLLLQLFFVYFGLPFVPVIGIKLDVFPAACLTFSLNYGAYLAEIFRAGIESIDKGQYEASKALGMTYFQTMRRIILPQTVKVVLPPTCSEAINLVKDSALIATIGMGDLLRNAKQVVTRDMNISAFVVAFILYLMMSSVIVKVFEKLEKKYSIYE